MSFDKEARNALARMVTACRKRLTEDVTDQLRGIFGLHPDGTVLVLDQLAHLSEEQKVDAQALRELLDHFVVGAAGTEEERWRAAYERLVLEISFTILNRLVALRLCEERGLVLECVRKGMASDGFRLFERLSGGALGTRYQTYRLFLESLFDELAVDLGMLFDRTTSQSAIFPSERCLEDVLTLLNDANMAQLWTQDETIGWVYQYFNPPEERRAMREKSSAPRNSRELAVRNQFFTPRYVVEFLTDNTLGRLWYEMHRGETHLKEDCRYLVRRPNEIFLDPGQQSPPAESDDKNLSQEELIKQPFYILHREKKDPRDIKVLDPACGSGHFLLYAYNLFETIYQEAWEDEYSPHSEATGKRLCEDYETRGDLLKALPDLILRHNLYGIDIDSRACQIAALALWLLAQRAYLALGLKPIERPPITKTNIVCAEPMPGEIDMLREFTAGLTPKVLGQFVEVVFEKMRLAGEAGSLLKIEEEIRDKVEEAKAEYQRELQRRRGEQSYLPGMSPQREPTLFDDLTDDEFWTRAENDIAEALELYARQAENGQPFQRRLFADDTIQGFAFVDVCQKRYDVVLMNPPFGDASIPSKDYIEEVYGDTKGDVYKTFIECFQDRLVPCGMLGMISSRAGFFLAQSTDWRERIVLRLYRPHLMADLGYGVLDAMVETAAYVLRSISEEENRQLTLSILSELRTVPTDREGAFSIPTYQQHRRGLKRHQVIQELTRLQKNGYVTSLPGYYARFRVNHVSIERADPPTPASYPPFICVRVLREENKDAALLESLQSLSDQRRFVVSPQSFFQVPNTPFCYWVSEHVRRLFSALPQFESQGREVRVGDHPGDGFRYLRLFWEVPIGPSARDWRPYQKGGEYSPYYYDLHLLADWDAAQQTYRGFYGRPGRRNERPSNYQYFFRAGLTWPRRTTSRISVRVLPKGCIFADKGPAVFARAQGLWHLLGLMNARCFEGLVALQLAAADAAARSYEVGIIQDTPVVDLSGRDGERLAELAEQCVDLKRNLDTSNEISHIFHLSELLQVAGNSLAERLPAWQTCIAEAERQLGQCQREIDNIAFHLYGIDGDDQRAIEGSLGALHAESTDDAHDADSAEDTAGAEPTLDPRQLVANLLSYAIGCVFGRWDVRFATGERQTPALPDPFAPLPVCSPGMLTGEEGLPLHTVPSEYLLRISWDGILVDDSGPEGTQPHQDDIVRRVREVLDLLWGDRAEAIEQEACEILGVRELREYSSRPVGFFEDHLKRYSKSRRKAPIYWPLSTASGSYTVWVYYQRLTDQTLYTIVNRYVEPKIAEVERVIAGIEKDIATASGRQATLLRDRGQEARVFLAELHDFRQELLRMAGLPYKPDINDGVIINAAPLYRMFRHRQWAKDTRDCWERLEREEYEWAHMAYTIWPERVREVCRRDRSIAIAHGLEALFEPASPSPGRRRRRQQG